MPTYGSWSPTYQSIWTHRKTFELAALLGLNETYAAAHVIRLCTWAIDNAPDGDLSALSDRAIAYGAGWTQEVSLFVGALMKSGYLDDDRVIHDWHDYAGRLIERRRDDAQRKQKSRGHAPDVRGTSNGASGLVRRREENSTEEENRGEKNYHPLPPPPAEGELTAPTKGDVTLWKTARERLRADMSRGNWDQLVAPLEPMGRAPDGGLRLRAPPGYPTTAPLAHVRKALEAEGEARADLASIVGG